MVWSRPVRFAATILLAAASLSAAFGAGPLRAGTDGAHASQRQATACTDVVGAGRTLAQDLPNLAPAGAFGTPELCLLDDAADDAFQAVVIGIDDAPAFAAAKAAAITQLQALGVDPCRRPTPAPTRCCPPCVTPLPA